MNRRLVAGGRRRGSRGRSRWLTIAEGNDFAAIYTVNSSAVLTPNVDGGADRLEDLTAAAGAFRRTSTPLTVEPSAFRWSIDCEIDADETRFPCFRVQPVGVGGFVANVLVNTKTGAHDIDAPDWTVTVQKAIAAGYRSLSMTFTKAGLAAATGLRCIVYPAYASTFDAEVPDDAATGAIVVKNTRIEVLS